MKKIYLFLLICLSITRGFSQTSTLRITKGTETTTHIDITFTWSISPSITFYSCNFQINYGDMTEPALLSVISPNANYTTNATTMGGLVLNCVVDDIPKAVTSVPVSWTIRFKKGSGSPVCFSIPTGGLNECLNTVGNNFPATIPNCTAVIPVELIDFQAQNKVNVNFLTWQTASERSNVGFHIERSGDGTTFENIGFVKGNGNSAQKQSYTFTDNAPPQYLLLSVASRRQQWGYGVFKDRCSCSSEPNNAQNLSQSDPRLL